MPSAGSAPRAVAAADGARATAAAPAERPADVQGLFMDGLKSVMLAADAVLGQLTGGSRTCTEVPAERTGGVRTTSVPAQGGLGQRPSSAPSVATVRASAPHPSLRCARRSRCTQPRSRA